MKSKYLEETRKSAENLELRQSEAAAWSATYKKLWREFQCCYYTCNGLVFNAIGEDYIFEIYELAQEIATPPTIPLPVKRKITTKEEYRETWFNLSSVLEAELFRIMEKSLKAAMDKALDDIFRDWK